MERGAYATWSCERLSGCLVLRGGKGISRVVASVFRCSCYDDYLHDSSCDEKSDLSVRSSTIEMRGELSSRQL